MGQPNASEHHVLKQLISSFICGVQGVSPRWKGPATPAAALTSAAACSKGGGRALFAQVLSCMSFQHNLTLTPDHRTSLAAGLLCTAQVRAFWPCHFMHFGRVTLCILSLSLYAFWPCHFMHFGLVTLCILALSLYAFLALSLYAFLAWSLYAFWPCHCMHFGLFTLCSAN